MGLGVPPPLVSGAVFMVLTVVTLALTFRMAFDRRWAIFLTRFQVESIDVWLS
jgi:hypothetical protein